VKNRKTKPEIPGLEDRLNWVMGLKKVRVIGLAKTTSSYENTNFCQK